MTLREEIEKIFKKYRFDEGTHIGLGDIRLTIGEQEKIIDQICKIVKERLEHLEIFGAVPIEERIDTLITELEEKKGGLVGG